MRHLLPIALLFLAACGSSDPKTLTSEGHAALGKGDAATALEKFDAALAKMNPKDAEYARADLGRCQALAKSDGAAARKAFFEYVARNGTKVREDDYGLVCSDLLQGGFTLDAIDIMDAGQKRFPESPRMIATKEAVVAAAKREKTPDALKKLESLGYAGGK